MYVYRMDVCRIVHPHIRPYYSIYIYNASLYRFLSEIAGRKDECGNVSRYFQSWTLGAMTSSCLPRSRWTSLVLSLGRSFKGRH